MIKLTAVLIFILQLSSTGAQDLQLQPLKLTLRAGATSVIREETTVFDIRSAGKAILSTTKLITVLNESAKEELSFYLSTDKFQTLKNFSATLYDGSGKMLRKYDKKDISSIVYGDAIVSDGKQNSLDIAVSSYPVHVQYEYEIEFNGILSYPAYYIQSFNQSVEKSTFKVIVPSGMDLRYKEKNISLKPAVTNGQNDKIYLWSVMDIPALAYEQGSSPWGTIPQIVLAPNRVSLDGYSGDLSSWQKFGEWYSTLCTESRDLSPERKLFFQQLVKDASGDREKAEIIYNYLQKNFRYVSIQLGIGGLKPFSASFTDKKKYGDCKGLSNYMQACLDAVGIKSYHALINASYNRKPVDPDFPINGFNHMILFVPMENDSIWLECTSNTNEFGVLGSFTENRNALLITEKGGVLVPTPRSMSFSNQFKTTSLVKINEDGSGIANIKISTTGEFSGDDLISEKEDMQKRYLVSYVGFADPDIMVLTPGDSKDKINVEMEFSRISAFSAGSKMFLHPRMYQFSRTVLLQGKRQSDYYFQYPFIKTDTTVYRLPDGFVAEAIPKTKKASFEFGDFEAQYIFKNETNELVTISRFELKQHIIPSASYDAARTFFDEVLAEYNSKIVVKKK